MSPTLLSIRKTATAAIPSGSEDRLFWSRVATEGLRPLATLMSEGRADLPIQGPASNHGAQADRLESFARPCLWAAHWLQSDAAELDSSLSKQAVAEWFRRGLILGTDPHRKQYWGPTSNHHQHTVEMGALVLAFEMAHDWLWEPLTHREKEQVAHWIASTRSVGFHRNNHLFFGVLPLSFLRKEGFGRASDDVCIERWLDVLETMSLEGGWFIDGMNESVDYYNAYAFHYYGLWWGLLYGEKNPARVQRWREWTHEFLGGYAHFFASSGEPVPFGRSMTYRFAASAPFALAEKCGVSPLPPGQARRLCTQNLKFFWKHAIAQKQGVLNIGWINEFPEMMEAYSCAASPYWAAKGLAPLLLEAESPFWTDRERPMPSEESDATCAIPSTGLIVRNCGGEVELLNGGTGICGGNTAFGPYKWGKLSYRTGVGFEIKRASGSEPLDAALTAEAVDGTVYARQFTHALEVTEEHLACAYTLGNRFTQFNVQVESHLWWRDGWQLHLHQYEAYQPVRLRLGSYSLAAADPEALEAVIDFPRAAAINDQKKIVLESLHGFVHYSASRTAAGQENRTHLYASNSVTLVLQSDWLEGSGWVAALSWVGNKRDTSAAWQVHVAEAGHWQLVDGKGTLWEIRHETLPALK